MNNSTARVVSVQSGMSGNRAVVEVDALVACARCAEGKGCGAGLLGQGERSRVLEAEVSPQLEVHEGDIVDIVMEPSSLLRASLLVYGLPLTTAVAFAGISWWFGSGDVVAVLMALAGLAGGLALARRKLRSKSCLREFTPTVVASR